MSLSVAIITLNEEANLARTLSSVAWGDEIIVVDSGSTDGTLEIARQFGAKPLVETWRGFGAQKNFALRHCTCDWILSLDADEEVSAELAQEIKQAIAGSPNAQAFAVSRRNLFLNCWLRHGGMYPDRKVRLIRNGAAWFEERPVHEDIRFDGEIRHLHGYLIHHAYPTLATYVEHLQRYSTLAASTVPPHGALWFAAQTLLNPYATFVYNYVLRGGFLDGRAGFIYHAYHSAYISWKYAKARQMQLAAKA